MVRTGYDTPWTKKTALLTKRKTASRLRRRRMLNCDELIMKIPYLSIIQLTMRCGMSRGLKVEHYRWVLVKDYGGLAKIQSPAKYEMENFFQNYRRYEGSMKYLYTEEEKKKMTDSDKEKIKSYCESQECSQDMFHFDLKDLYENKYIEKDCISSNSNLYNYLEKLIKYDVLSTTIDEQGKKRFLIKYKAVHEINRALLIKNIRECPDHLLHRLLERIDFTIKNDKKITEDLEKMGF